MPSKNRKHKKNQYKVLIIGCICLLLLGASIIILNAVSSNYKKVLGATATVSTRPIIGAWYYSGWSAQYTDADGTTDPCGAFIDDPWKPVRDAQLRPIDYLVSTTNLSGYVVDKTIGYVLSQPASGTIPLSFTVQNGLHKYTTGQSSNNSVGYIFTSQIPGTIPLYKVTVYNNIQKLMTDPLEVWDAYVNGYILGYDSSNTRIKNQEDKAKAVIGYIYQTRQMNSLALTRQIKYLPGQLQPRQPLVGSTLGRPNGYQPDNDPAVMKQYIDWATHYGLDFFAFEWFPINNPKCSQQIIKNKGLETFLKSPNNANMKFVVGWFPLEHGNYHDDVASVQRTLTYFLTNYAHRPNYLTFDGKPVFIWSYIALPEELKNATSMQQFVHDANIEAKRQGFKNGIYFIGNSGSPDQEKIIGFNADSNGNVNDLPVRAGVTGNVAGGVENFNQAVTEFAVLWNTYITRNIPYVTSVLAGWDRSPWLGINSSILTNNSPGQFKQELLNAKKLINANPNTTIPMILITSWNEWGEGSMIEPDTYWKTGYLEEIQSVFGLNSSLPRLPTTTPRNFTPTSSPWPSSLPSRIPTPTVTVKPSSVSVYRLHNIQSKDYFYTTSFSEVDSAQKKYGYIVEDTNAFKVYSSQVEGTKPVYRLNGPNSDHYLTIKESDRDGAINNHYKLEGVAFYAYDNPVAGSVPLYQLNTGGTHFYTVSATEKDSAVSQYHFTYEGIPFYVLPQ